MLNLKQVRLKIHGPGPFTMTLSVKGEKEVKAKDFDAPSQVEVVSKDAHIATLTSKKSVLNLEAVVEGGLGYQPVEARTKEKVEVGVIALDAFFSPVRHVNYEVENMRLGDRTDYNRVRLHIETDGSLTPREALLGAAAILVEQFDSLTKGFTEAEAGAPGGLDTESSELPREIEGEASALKMKIDELKLSARTLNALREAGVKTVGGLARKKEEALREVEGLGEKGMQEIKKALGNLGITLKQ